MENDNFSLFSQEQPTKETLEIVFKPSDNIVKYVYRVYSDSILVDSGKINSNEARTITLNSTGNYQIKVEAYDSFSREYEYESGKYVIDKEAPTLEVGDSVLNLNVGDSVNVSKGVSASDNYDGNITQSITTNISTIDLSTSGTKKLIYTVSDTAGNTATKSVILNVEQQNVLGLFIVQLFILSFLVLIIIDIFKYRRIIKMEKRYGKYAVEPLEDKSPSIFDDISRTYYTVAHNLSKRLSKSVFLKKYAKKFDKYLLFTGNKYQTGMDIVSSKFLIAVIFLLIAVASKALHYELLGPYEVCFPMILGFFVLDILYMFEYKFYRNQIENDLLQAIIIMNNAFKSGRSIVQAIDLVGHELKGLIGEQFTKMSKELAAGLTIEEVFSRFAERINIEEVTYITASLSILNKTGGDIIKVFSSIENSLFLKKKLRLELKSLTGSSKIIMWVLFLVPLLFVIVISVLSPGYFLPFFSSSTGLLMFFMMIVYYVVYIVAVRKILKVRM